MTPIDRFGGKETAEYLYFAQDFETRRRNHWMSICLQAAPSVLLPDIHSVLEFGGGRDLTRTICRYFGIEYLSVDVSDRFFPDVVSPINQAGDLVERKRFA